MKPVVTVAEMRAVDAAALATVSEDTLVERAGTAVATVAVAMLGGCYGRRVTVLAGKGNNGADGRVAARHLTRRGARCQVVEVADAPGRLDGADLVIDAAFGTGFRGTWDAPEVADGTPVLAVDIPSGVDGDTGVACGHLLRGDRTVTFAAWKPGLLQADGALLAGEVTVADIGLDSGDAVDRCAVVEDGDVAPALPGRPRDAHKWQSALLVVAGSPGMLGAATFVSRAAGRSGAGMVRLCVPGADPGSLPVSEAVATATDGVGWAPAVLAVAARCKAVAIGPGLGRSDDTLAAVRAVVEQTALPVVLDADGLVAAAAGPGGLAGLVARRPGGAAALVVTPHDGEFATLAGAPPGPDRIGAARALAASAGVVVLLKGSPTVVAEPGGRTLVVTSGTSRLATAGTGDVLSGAIGALCARGVEPQLAAALGAHVHGRAAAAATGARAAGLLAGDLPDLMAAWLADHGDPAGHQGRPGGHHG